jgi:hypothetical protein
MWGTPRLGLSFPLEEGESKASYTYEGWEIKFKKKLKKISSYYLILIMVVTNNC